MIWKKKRCIKGKEKKMLFLGLRIKISDISDRLCNYR